MKLTAKKIKEIIEGLENPSKEKVADELTKQGYELNKNDELLVGACVYIHKNYKEKTSEN